MSALALFGHTANCEAEDHEGFLAHGDDGHMSRFPEQKGRPFSTVFFKLEQVCKI